MSGSLPLPFESLSCPSESLIAERLYSTLKYHLRFLGGCAVGSVSRRSRQDLSEAKKDCTHASAVCACNFLEVKRRIRCLGLSQSPLCRTVRQKNTTVLLKSRPHAWANSSSFGAFPIFTGPTWAIPISLSVLQCSYGWS